MQNATSVSFKKKYKHRFLKDSCSKAGIGKVFHKGSGSKCFQFCEPCGLCCSSSVAGLTIIIKIVLTLWTLWKGLGDHILRTAAYEPELECLWAGLWWQEKLPTGRMPRMTPTGIIEQELVRRAVFTWRPTEVPSEDPESRKTPAI